MTLHILNIPQAGHGFHVTIHSEVQLEHIIADGLWCSSADWSYLQNSSQAISLVPHTLHLSFLLTLAGLSAMKIFYFHRLCFWNL